MRSRQIIQSTSLLRLQKMHSKNGSSLPLGRQLCRQTQSQVLHTLPTLRHCKIYNNTDRTTNSSHLHHRRLGQRWLLRTSTPLTTTILPLLPCLHHLLHASRLDRFPLRDPNDNLLPKHNNPLILHIRNNHPRIKITNKNIFDRGTIMSNLR